MHSPSLEGWLVFRMSAGDLYLQGLVVAFASLAASIFWASRPQMFSYALTAAVSYVLFLRRFRGVDVVWSLSVLMLVWANLHGAFAIGLLLIGAVIAREALAFGGYPIHTLPNVPVLVDGRSDFCGGAFLDEYFTIAVGNSRWSASSATASTPCSCGATVGSRQGFGTARTRVDWSER